MLELWFIFLWKNAKKGESEGRFYMSGVSWCTPVGFICWSLLYLTTTFLELTPYLHCPSNMITEEISRCETVEKMTKDEKTITCQLLRRPSPFYLWPAILIYSILQCVRIPFTLRAFLRAKQEEQASAWFQYRMRWCCASWKRLFFFSP